MATTDILFIDLLYRPKGSFDDDFATIAKSLEGRRFFHLKVMPAGNFKALWQVVSTLWRMSPRQVVFLSAKIWQLILLAPLMLFRRSYAVYHFRPNTRAKMHDRVLPWLARVYGLGAYSAGVQRYVRDVTGRPVPLLASRLIDKRLSLQRLQDKLGQDHVDVFCPGIRPGVRDPLDYKRLRRGLEKALAKPVRDVVVQDSSVDASAGDASVRWAKPMLSDEDYARLYDDSLVIAMKFARDYEVRSSAMINDALGRGCILLTEPHAIVAQYGFPAGLVTDLEHLSAVLSRVASGRFGAGDIPGFDVAEARQSWAAFLDPGV